MACRHWLRHSACKGPHHAGSLPALLGRSYDSWDTARRDFEQTFSFQVPMVTSVTAGGDARTLGDFSLLLIPLSSFLGGGGRGIFFYTAKFKIFFIEFPTRYYISWSQTKKIIKTSMMVQWLRVYLSVQRTWVQSLVQEDPTCRGAIRPVSHDYWAWALQPGSSNKRSHRSD